jgi:molybdopterin converting factor small subunit
MPVKVRIPGAMRTLAGGQTRFEVDAHDVAQALSELEAACPAFTPELRDAQGGLRPRVGIYVNDVHVRYLHGLATPLHDGDQVYVLPIVMGG